MDMSRAASDLSRIQSQPSYDQVRGIEAAFCTDHNLAAKHHEQPLAELGHALGDAQNVSDWKATYCEATSGNTIPEDYTVVYDSPEDTDSDESMNQNHENVTPPPTPPQPDSPGAAAALRQLSLDNSGSTSQGQCQQARDPAMGAYPVASKRHASSDFSPRDRPVTHLRGLRNPSQYRAMGAKGVPRQGRRPGQKQIVSRVNVVSQRRHAARYDGQVFADVYHRDPRAKQAVHRDSGYETMPSRHNTFQQRLPESEVSANMLRPKRPLRQVKEQSGEQVIRLAGPVPVLIDSRYPKLIMQPESSPISQDQLAAEVKGIYGGLVMVEAKCINIDAAQAADPDSTLGKEQWQALIALHRTLLYEHHDFLMATQHPSATSMLSGLAQKYSMPARMWRHGIHAFLEVLRHRRPQSQDYMLAFIYLAYQMMALLYETVPAFTDTWIECLGDLARYRMAIEEEKEVHSIWSRVAARWYNKASDRHPSIGRLYHHLGILEPPGLEKIFLYTKSLTSLFPFPNARDSLGTLCNPIVQGQQAALSGLPPMIAHILKLHAHLFASPKDAMLNGFASQVLSQLAQQPSATLRHIGVRLIVINIGALFEFGDPSSQLLAHFGQSLSRAIESSRPSAAAFPAVNNVNEPRSDVWPLGGTNAGDIAYEFAYSSFERILRCGKDRQSLRDALSSVHTILVWLHSVHTVQVHSNTSDDTIGSLFDNFAWGELCTLLNTLNKYESISKQTIQYAEKGVFPGSEFDRESGPKPLSEDFLIRGLIWSQSYFPDDWFSCQSEDDGRDLETDTMHHLRVQRVLYLGLYLALHSDCLDFDECQMQFSTSRIQRQCWLPLAPSPIPVENSAPTNTNNHSEERRRAPTPKSRSSTTISAHSDSEGYTIINTHKSKLSHSMAASEGYDAIRVIDDDHDMEFSP